METHPVAHTENLARINQKILAPGETLPGGTMKDGSRVQTGTVAAMIHNVRLYNEGIRGEVERELELAVPTLFKVGLFGLFSPEEWVKGENPGRRYVGEKALQYLKAPRS